MFNKLVLLFYYFKSLFLKGVLNSVFLYTGASFAEALGMCTMAQTSRKRTNNSPNTSTAKMFKAEQSTASNKKIAGRSESTIDTLQVLCAI